MGPNRAPGRPPSRGLNADRAIPVGSRGVLGRGRSSRFGGSADRQQLASRHHAGRAVAALVAGQERVEAVPAGGARQVVREVLLVLVARVPHGTFTSSTYPGSHPWSPPTSVGAGRTAANGPRGPCGGTESHQWSRSPAAAAREDGARRARARRVQTRRVRTRGTLGALMYVRSRRPHADSA